MSASSLAEVVSCHAHCGTHELSSHRQLSEDRKSAYSHFIHKQFIRPLERVGQRGDWQRTREREGERGEDVLPF